MATRKGFRRGFTLLEAALAIVIVGTGVLAGMRMFVACSDQNRTAMSMTTAMLLANNIQEMTASLSFNDPFLSSTYFGPEPNETLATYNDVDDFDGSNFSPPLDPLRNPIPALSQYTQAITVVPVYTTQLSANTNPTTPSMPKTTYTGAVRVMVRILYKRTATDTPNEVYRRSWIRVDR